MIPKIVVSLALLSFVFVEAPLIAQDKTESGSAIDTAANLQLLKDAKRIVFLGDSVTYGGAYITAFDAWLETQSLANDPVVINMGLPSETVSGLSEENHAGGRFPRPDLAERLDRVLATTKPDLVFACYGINCGIYQPFDPTRFAAYQTGIHNLKSKVETTGAKIIFITPPTFDDARGKKEFSYNGVLDKYADWLIKMRDAADSDWKVIDLHHPMTAELAARRESDAEFTFQPDAVHPNAAGHAYVASQLISWFGGSVSPDSMKDDLAKLGLTAEEYQSVQRRMKVLRDAYVTAAGHLRPGVQKGMAVDAALEEARKFSGEID